MRLAGASEKPDIVSHVAKRADQRAVSRYWLSLFWVAVLVRGMPGSLRKSLFMAVTHASYRHSNRNIGLVQNPHITIKSTRTLNSMRGIELSACYS